MVMTTIEYITLKMNLLEVNLILMVLNHFGVLQKEGYQSLMV